jgi:ketosteroid isomerase-like protein
MATNESRSAILVRAVEASITGDVSSLEELFTQDVVGSMPGITISSREELAIEMEEREDTFSGFAVTVSPLDVAGDRACVEWVAAAVHSGPLALDDLGRAFLEASGRRLELRGVTVAEFDGDRICRFRHYWDEVALLVGLGLVGQD